MSLRNYPEVFKALLLLFFTLLCLVALHLVPSTFAKGWLQGTTMLVALGLLVRPMIVVVKTK